MDFLNIARWVAILGLAVGALGVLIRLKEILDRPFKRDLSRSRGSPWRGILYAFTLGMAPWEKESTRLHWVAYLRGILFHVGVFAAFAVFLAVPWLERLPTWLVWIGMFVTGIGAVFGLLGIWMRLSGKNERALSLPDDYFAILICSLFSGLACASLVVQGALPWFYLVTGVLAVYLPLGKIRHCIYFFYSKFFFGSGFGRRGVLATGKNGFQE